MKWKKLKLTLGDLCTGAYVVCNQCGGSGEEDYYRHHCGGCDGTGRLLSARGEAFLVWIEAALEAWLAEHPLEADPDFQPLEPEPFPLPRPLYTVEEIVAATRVK